MSSLERLPAHRGDADQSHFLEPEVFLRLGAHSYDHAIEMLEGLIADVGREPAMVLGDFIRLRRAHEARCNFQAGTAVAHRERSFLDGVRQPIPQLWSRHSIAAYAVRAGEYQLALDMVEEALQLESEAGSMVHGSDRTFLMSAQGKLRVTQVEALLGASRYHEALECQVTNERWFDQCSWSLGRDLSKAFLALFEERNGIPLSTGRSFDEWIDALCSTPPYTYGDPATSEFSHFTHRFALRAICSALKVVDPRWQHPEHSEERRITSR